MRVLVFGAGGMIGSTMMRVLSAKAGLQVFGTVRHRDLPRFLPKGIGDLLQVGVDDWDSVVRLFGQIMPSVVINCVGLTKHVPYADDPLAAIPINTLLPHRLAGLCKLVGVRLIHISTDCVFSGEKGNYVESDFTDARDVYGRSKALGEVNCPNTITLRTSTIGHEFRTKFGLLEWFLSQNGQCKGYTNAIFSGLPTVVLAEIVRDIVIPSSDLSGIFHVAARPINKFDLLSLIAGEYGKIIDIIRDDSLVIDRSLNASRFQLATGYVAPEWPELIKLMHDNR